MVSLEPSELPQRSCMSVAALYGLAASHVCSGSKELLSLNHFGRRCVWKMIVLRDKLELSGLSIHKTITHNHFLTISKEFGAEYDRDVTGISIGIFFPFDVRISLPKSTIT